MAMTLAQFAPSIAKWLGGNKAEAIAQKAIDIAKTVSGQPTADQALSAITGSPELVLQYRQAVLDQEMAFQKLAVDNAKDINTTMQGEASAEHWPTYTWRPMIGLVFGVNMLIMGLTTAAVYICIMFGVPGAIAAVASLPQMIGALGAVNGAALPVLGIASWFRGKMQADPSITTNNRG